MEKHRKTFLSYSRANKDFAMRLAKELKAEGFDVWLDQLDIPAGSRWDREVEKALKECEIFMIIITPASIDSENVLDEIGYAIDTHKRILPVLLEKSEVPLRLRRLQYVDFTNKSFDEGVESAKELLRELINQPTLPNVKLSDDEKKQLSMSDSDRKANEDAGQRAGEIAKAKAHAEDHPVEVQQTAPMPGMNEKAASVKPLPVNGNAMPVSSEPGGKGPVSRTFLYSIGLLAVLAVLVVAGVAFSSLARRGNENLPVSTLTTGAIAVAPATEAPVTEVPTEVPPEDPATEAVAPMEVSQPDFSDTFDDDSMGWDTGQTSSDYWDGTRSITNGYYLWDLTLIEDEDFISQVPYPGQEISIENFDVSVDIRRLAGTPENACFGLYFRENAEEAYYLFEACDDQTYQVSYFDGEEWEDLQDWTDVDLIRPDDWNNLRVVGNGDAFDFYINDELVIQISDSRLPVGDIGLAVNWYDTIPGQISFDNFKLSIK